MNLTISPDREEVFHRHGDIETSLEHLLGARHFIILFDYNNSGGHIVPTLQLKKLNLREVKCIAKVTPKVRDQAGI